MSEEWLNIFTELVNLEPVLYTIASRIIAKMAAPQTSRFLSLPSELRQLIYEELFANTQLIIEDGKAKYGTWPTMTVSVTPKTMPP